VDYPFGANVDFAMLAKVFCGDEAKRERLSPSETQKAGPIPVIPNPKFHDISTSFVERQNLTMRIHLRRLARLTNAFYKKLANLKAALALHFASCNFFWIYSSLRVTSATHSGLTDHAWPIGELLAQQQLGQHPPAPFLDSCEERAYNHPFVIAVIG
jgi:hypothetical protein